MGQVFVSYAQEDKAIADAVVAKLESNKISCWYAPRDITPGKEWAEAITDAIDESQVMVVIYSEHSNRSYYVQSEVSVAIDYNTIVIPFRVENLLPAGAMKLHLARTHWLDAYDPSWENYLDVLKNTIQKIVNGEDHQELKLNSRKSPTQKISHQKKVFDKKIIPWLIFSLALLGLIIAAISIRSGNLFNQERSDKTLSEIAATQPIESSDAAPVILQTEINFDSSEDRYWLSTPADNEIATGITIDDLTIADGVAHIGDSPVRNFNLATRIGPNNLVHFRTRMAGNGPCYSVELGAALQKPQSVKVGVGGCENSSYNSEVVFNQDNHGNGITQEIPGWGGVTVIPDQWVDILMWLSPNEDRILYAVVNDINGQANIFYGGMMLPDDWQVEKWVAGLSVYADPNKPGMQVVDTDFIRTANGALDHYMTENFPFTEAQIKEMQRIWLGDLPKFAGDSKPL